MDHEALLCTEKNESLFISADEVGRIFRVKKSRTYEMYHAGLLPGVRLGRRILFSRRGILAMEQSAIDRAMGRQSDGQLAAEA